MFKKCSAERKRQENDSQSLRFHLVRRASTSCQEPDFWWSIQHDTDELLRISFMNIIKTCWGESVQLTRRSVYETSIAFSSYWSLISLPLATASFVSVSRTGIEMYMKSSKKNGVQGSSLSLRQIQKYSNHFQNPRHQSSYSQIGVFNHLSIVFNFHETILRRWLDHLGIPKENLQNSPTKSWLRNDFRSARHHSMLHDIVHKEKAARGAIEDFQQKKSMPRPCEFLWSQNPTDYLWKLKNTLSKLSEQVFGYGECSHLGVRSYWLRRKWSEVNIIRLSKSERYTQIFQQPAYRQLLYLCFLNSWWRIPQVSQVSIYLCFATIIIIIFLWVSRRNQLHIRWN